MANWRVLIPIGIAVALWVVISRVDVAGNLSLPAAATAPCRPTAAEVAATDVARAAQPTTTPTPPIESPVVTTELVVLAEDRDIPLLIPSLIIRAPVSDQPAINKLLGTAYLGTDSETASSAAPAGAIPPTEVPIFQRVDNNAYRLLLKQLLTNEDNPEAGDDIGLLTETSTNYTPLLRDALGISEPPLVSVGGNGTLTLVIPQTPRRLADNYETFAGGWAVTSSGRSVSFLFDGRPEAKTAWEVRVCTDGLPIISTSLLTPTPDASSPTPIVSPTRSPAGTSSVAATPPKSELVYENAHAVHWSFPTGREPTAVQVITQAPLPSAFRMFLSTNFKPLITALALFVPTGLLFIGLWLALRSGSGNAELEGAKARLAATSMAVIRVAIAAVPYAFDALIISIIAARGWGSMSYLAFVAAASVGLGFIDLPRPRLEGRRQWAEEFALALIAIAAVGIAFAYLSGVQPAREQYRLIYPGLLVVAYTMFLATGIRLWSRPGADIGPWRVMALPAIGAVSLLLCVLRGEVEDRLLEYPFLSAGLVPIWVTVCVVVGTVLLAISLLRAIALRPHTDGTVPQSEVELETDRPKSLVLWAGTCVGVVLVIAAILLQWGWAIYSEATLWWRAAIEADPVRNLGSAFYANFAVNLQNYPLEFFVSVIDLLVILGLLGSVAVLHAAANPAAASASRTSGHDLARAVSWRSHQDWELWMLLALFAAFVIGYGGQIIGLRAPIAFLIGVVLLRFTVSTRVEAMSNRIDEMNGGTQDGTPLIISHRGELLHRALSLANLEQQLAKALRTFTNGETSAGDYKTKLDQLSREAEAQSLGQAADQGSTALLKLSKDDAPGELALTTGPKQTWWENGALALSLGSRLAIVPIVYFLYVFLNSQEGAGWSLNTPFATVQLATSLAYEVAFWLVAALTFGCLFPFLPGRTGPIKGAVLAAVYVGANAAAALLGIPGNALWQVRSFQLLLFLTVLGGWMDVKTVEGVGFRRRDLFAIYDLPNTATLVSQVLPLVTALVAVVGQLLLGQTQAATENLLSGEGGKALLNALGIVR